MSQTELQPLQVNTKIELSPELGMTPAANIKVAENSGLRKQADALVARLYAISPQDLEEQQKQVSSVSSLGHALQTEIARKSAMLKTPMQRLMKDADDGGPVAQTLLQLQEQVSNINPNQFDFDMGGFRKLLAKIPGIGTPISRWLARYQSVESVIQDVIKSLEAGKTQLERDNVTLTEDQIDMRQLTIKLEDYVKFGQLVDQTLEQKITANTSLDAQRKKFLQEEIQFPLRQRVLDLQQQLAVNQQGVLTTEIIIRNNKELVRGVGRALNVTVPALNTATTLALALQNQKRVLDGVQKVTDTTNELIGQTAKQLKTQGVAIQKQASSAMLDIDKLKAAFTDVQSAIDDLSTFRQEALPQMAQSMVEMDQLTTQMESAIKDSEASAKYRENAEIDLDSL